MVIRVIILCKEIILINVFEEIFFHVIYVPYTIYIKFSFDDRWLVYFLKQYFFFDGSYGYEGKGQSI